MSKIKLSKSLEILELNLKDGAIKMPPDVRTALELSMDMHAGLIAERQVYGFTRIGQLPHEQPEK